MHQLKLIRTFIFVCALSLCSLNKAENQEIKNNDIPSVLESSQDLWKSLGTFFHSVGREIADQAQELNKRVGIYIESLKKEGQSSLFSIEQKTTENSIVIAVKGFEHVDTATTHTAHLEYNRRAVADKIVINVGPHAVVTVSEYLDQNVAKNNWLTVFVEAQVHKTEELQEGEKIVTKTSEFMAKRNTSFLVRHEVDFEKLLVEFDGKNKELIIAIPFVLEQKKSVEVHIK
jgi:hypothetical protein